MKTIETKALVRSLEHVTEVHVWLVIHFWLFQKAENMMLS